MGRTEKEYQDDQAECVAKIKHKWLSWPAKQLDLEDANIVEASIRKALDAE